MSNAFHFTVKALFVLKIYKFLSWFFGQVEKGLIRKIRVILKSMRSQSGKQTITTHIFLNNWKSKGNKTFKFGQLIEYNMKKIFLEKSYSKSGGKTISRLFSKKSKLIISLDQKPKVLSPKDQMPSWRLSKDLETKLQTTCFDFK